jgi:phage tail-like protein
MSCLAQAPTFRLLDWLVGWDPASVQGISGMDREEGITLERVANPWTSADISRAIPPARLARGCGCDWYLVTPCPPESRLLRKSPCECEWRPVWGCECPPAPIQCAEAVAEHCGNLAIADPGARKVWLLGDGGRLLKLAIAIAEPGPVTHSPWGAWLVVDREQGVLRSFDPGGREGPAQFAALPGAAERIGVDARCRVWLVTAENGQYRIWWTERGARVWTEADLGALVEAFPDTGITNATGQYFCLGECCASWYGRPADPDPHPAPPPESYARQGQLLTLALDSGIPRCRWHRVRIDAAVPDEATLTVAVSTHEDADPPPQGDESDPAWQGFDAGVPHPQDWQSGPAGARDFLVMQPAGRYLFVRIRMTGNGYQTPVLHRLRLDFPRQSSADRLPGIYRENPEAQDFTERFLALFDAAVEGIDQAIERVPALLDSQGAPPEILPWLGAFLDVAMDSSWTAERRRKVLKAIPAIYRRRGTVVGLRETVELLHDIEPVIQESALERMWGAVGSAAFGQVRLFNPAQARFRVGRSPLGRAPLHSYGDPNLDPVTAQAFRFRVFLPGVLSERERLRIAALIESQKPAHTVASVSGSRRGFVLGPASRVGVDTALAGLEAPVLGRANLRLNRASVLWHGGCDHGPALRAGQLSAVGVNTVME